MPRVFAHRKRTQAVDMRNSLTVDRIYLSLSLTLSRRSRRNDVSVDLLSQLLSYALERMKHVRGVSAVKDYVNTLHSYIYMYVRIYIPVL